jgi:hypothetical protein
MAKEQPTPLEPLELETVYFIEQCREFPYNNQWIIYSNTKYGKKMFMNYYTMEDAINASKLYKLAVKND